MARMKRFFRTLMVGAGLSAIMAVGGTAAPAQTTNEEPAPAPARTTSYPAVSGLKPFSGEANYMSRPGYLRFLVYQRDGVWMSRHDAVAVVDQQIAAGEE